MSARPRACRGHRMFKSCAPLALAIAVLAILAFPVDALAQGWTPEGGGDHAGLDWTPADGTIIGGVHINIGIFRVANGTTVRVRPWDGTQYGEVDVRAEVITI